jgi:hypothetical protein
MKVQKRIKFKRAMGDSMRFRKLSSMFNSVNQQNLKMNNGKSKEQATWDKIWKMKNKNRNSGISEHLSIKTLNVNEINSSIKNINSLIGSKAKIQKSLIYKTHSLQPKTHRNQK